MNVTPERRRILREQVAAMQGTVCAIPGCDQAWVDVAHIEASGMGGRASTYVVENLAGLCRPCHDTFDGRDLHGRQDMLRRLLRTVVEVQRASRARFNVLG